MGNITDELTLPKDLVSTVLRKELSILGTWNSIYRPQKPDDWKDSIEFIQNGVRPSELVSHWISLEELPDTLKKLYDHKVRKKAFDSVKVMVNNRA
jgi:threonine dehydrogenase-like Zn-dependent dehydrogenase